MKQVMTTTALMCTLAFSTGAAPDALAEVVHGKQATANAAGLAPAIRADVDGLGDQWNGVTAPEDASALTPAGQVQAQASRIQLAAGS